MLYVSRYAGRAEDHVLLAIYDVQEALAIEARDVAGMEPSIGDGLCGRVRTIDVFLDDAGAFHAKLAGLDVAIPGYCALIRPGLIDRAPLVWATCSIVAPDAFGLSRFEQGLCASACVDQLDRMMTPSTYVVRAYHDDILDLISTVALAAGVMVRSVNPMRVEAPVSAPVAADEQPSKRPPPRSGTANQTGYESRSKRNPNCRNRSLARGAAIAPDRPARAATAPD